MKEGISNPRFHEDKYRTPNNTIGTSKELRIMKCRRTARELVGQAPPYI